jgi:hypothetical protein
MRIIDVLLAALLLSAVALGQVLSPMEITDPSARVLQNQHVRQLEAAGAEIQAHHFPYHFYFSRVLDLNEDRQRAADQRSIRFEKYGQLMALELTGNYYASYSAEKLTGNQRARQTFNDAILPMLKIVSPLFSADEAVQAYAFEISHHVRRTVMGVATENPENLVMVFTRGTAQQLLAAQDAPQQQSALLDAEVYVNGQRTDLWLTEDAAQMEAAKRERHAPQRTQPQGAMAEPAPAHDPTVSSKLLNPPALPARLVSKQDLDKLRAEHQDTLASMQHGIDDQAHFVSYAPPSFIAFHQGAYLQLSVTSDLPATAAGSRYRMAAFAFDEHIAHLIRPVLVYFQQDPDFDGIDFSTTIKAPAGEAPEAVEFILPFNAMGCYQNYECTGQQLLNAGIVLINGERVGLDLIVAEANTR